MFGSLGEPAEAGGPGPGGSDQGCIDAHVHVWTDDVRAYPLAEGFKPVDMQPPRFTPEDLFAHAGPCGVTRIVLIQMSYYGFDNNYMLDAIRRHPGVFSGVAVVDAAAKPAEAMGRLTGQGVRGFRIQPAGQHADQWLDGPGMAEIWRAAAELRAAVCCLVNPEFLPAIDRMCGRFADTTVVIDHFGRIGIDGRIRDADVRNLCALARHPHTYVKVSAFYALGRKTPPYTDLAPLIRHVYDAFGPQRLMWASDAPFQVGKGHDYRSSIDLVRKKLDFLGDSDRQWLLKKTAAKLFFAENG